MKCFDGPDQDGSSTRKNFDPTPTYAAAHTRGPSPGLDCHVPNAGGRGTTRIVCPEKPRRSLRGYHRRPRCAYVWDTGIRGIKNQHVGCRSPRTFCNQATWPLPDAQTNRSGHGCPGRYQGNGPIVETGAPRDVWN